jgi:hypothetical protein
MAQQWYAFEKEHVCSGYVWTRLERMKVARSCQVRLPLQPKHQRTLTQRTDVLSNPYNLTNVFTINALTIVLL